MVIAQEKKHEEVFIVLVQYKRVNTKIVHLLVNCYRLDIINARNE